MPQLIVPRIPVAPSVRAAARQYGDDLQERYCGDVADLADDGLAGYVDRLLADTREGTARPSGYVPSTHLWWVDGADFLGGCISGTG